MTGQSLRAKTLLLLSRHGVKIDPSLDEQQLVDPEIISRFVDHCTIKSKDTVIEIGPGAGNITEALLDNSRFLICIEKNPKYLPILHERFREIPKLKIIQDDALKIKIPRHDRLVSNLPYMIAEAFFQRTLRLEFKSATFIVPAGFAESLLAEPPSEKYSKVSWLSHLFYNVNQHEMVPPEAYLPQPRVSTIIVSIKPRPNFSPSERVLRDLMQQGDKYTKNALRETLIKTGACTSKNEARKYIQGLELPQLIIESRVSGLSLDDLTMIERILIPHF
jgi:16S rRNA (adenine1518-N6/adenine1519-N6)-dimethyltransferase